MLLKLLLNISLAFLEIFRDAIGSAGFVPSLVVVLAWLGVFRFFRKSFVITSLLALPGTIIHELAHVMCALATGARPAGFSIFPKRIRNPNGTEAWVFGTASFYRLNLFNKAFVGMAPVLLLPLGLWLFAGYLVPFFQLDAWLYWLGFGYLTASILYGSIPSVVDFRVAGWSLVMWALILGGVGYFGIRMG